MEDASPVAITLQVEDQDQLTLSLAELQTAVRQVIAMMRPSLASGRFRFAPIVLNKSVVDAG